MPRGFNGAAPRRSGRHPLRVDHAARVGASTGPLLDGAEDTRCVQRVRLRGVASTGPLLDGAEDVGAIVPPTRTGRASTGPLLDGAEDAAAAGLGVALAQLQRGRSSTERKTRLSARHSARRSRFNGAAPRRSGRPPAPSRRGPRPPASTGPLLDGAEDVGAGGLVEVRPRASTGPLLDGAEDKTENEIL